MSKKIVIELEDSFAMRMALMGFLRHIEDRDMLGCVLVSHGEMVQKAIMSQGEINLALKISKADPGYQPS